jgi:hypothetical protein
VGPKTSLSLRPRNRNHARTLPIKLWKRKRTFENRHMIWTLRPPTGRAHAWHLSGTGVTVRNMNLHLPSDGVWIIESGHVMIQDSRFRGAILQTPLQPPEHCDT